MKLLNNYAKFFTITTCEANRKLTDLQKDIIINLNASNPVLKVSHNEFYGKCFDDGEVWVEGKFLNETEKKWISNVYQCFNYEDGCPQLDSLPTIHKRKNKIPKYWWNYAEEIKKYYPDNYIKENMWDMTHYDYDDSPFCKAHNYHMDNNLPGFDVTIDSPHNIIAVPKWKGFGYTVSYNKQYGNNKYLRFPNKKGWWSDVRKFQSQQFFINYHCRIFKIEIIHCWLAKMLVMILQ